MTRRTARRSKDVYTGPPRCAIYVRVSGTKQERDGSSLETQEAASRCYAQEHGYVVVAIHSDVHTGKNFYERQGIAALREAIRAREVDVVIAHALDRLSRNQNHLGLLFSECDHKGVRVEFVTEELKDTAEGRLLQAVRGFVAEVEREKIRERTQRGTRARAEAGKLLASNRPLYGYRWRDETKGAFDVDPITSPVVKRIFRDAASGFSLRKIAQALTSEGILTPMGLDKWRASTVHGILTKPAYVGQAAAFHTSRQVGVEALKLPDGTIPPLVDNVAFQAVQRRLAVNKERASRNNHHPDETLLRGGIARCAYCGNALSTRQDRGRASRSYFCSNTNRDRYGCPAFTMQAHLLDPRVWGIIEQFLTDEDVIRAKLKNLQTSDHARCATGRSCAACRADQ